jgi:Family of unknown function (DUF6084)
VDDTSVAVPRFTGELLVDLELPCTLDFNIAATKYFHALDSGDIPVAVMFSGTLFYEGPMDGQNAGALQISQIPWDR